MNEENSIEVRAGEEESMEDNQERILEEAEASANIENWDEFYEFIINGVRPAWLPETFQLSEVVLEQLRDRVEAGLSDAIVSQQFLEFSSFNRLGGSNSLFDLEGLDDEGHHNLNNEFMSTEGKPSSLISELNQGMDSDEKIPEFDSNYVHDFSFENEAALDHVNTENEIHHIATDADFAPEKDEELKAQEEISQSLLNQQIADANSEEMLKALANNGPRQYEQVSNAEVVGKAAVHSLSKLAGGLLRGSANMGNAFAGSTVAMGTWGAEKLSGGIKRVFGSNEKVDACLEAANQESFEQSQERRNTFREDNLSANVKNITDVMAQVREELVFMNQPSSGLDMSLYEMKEMAKTAEDPLAVKLANHHLKESIVDYGVEKLLDNMDAIQYGNEAIGQYLSNAELFAEKLGVSDEDLKGHVGDVLEDYSGELEGAAKMFGELIDYAEQSGLLEDGQDAQAKAQLEKLQESVAKLIAKLSDMFTRGAKATVAPGM